MIELLLACTISADIRTLDALIQTESSYNPYAIALVKEEPLKRQPQSLKEAQKIIMELENRGSNYSVGLGQINKANFKKFNVTGLDLLDPCLNLQIAEKILLDCKNNSPNNKMTEALSCYYSGNYKYGFVKEKNGTSYIERVKTNYDLRRSIGKQKDYKKYSIGSNAYEGKSLKLQRSLPNQKISEAHIFK